MSTETFVIERQEGYRFILSDQQLRVLHPVKALSIRDHVVRSDLVAEDLDDCSIKFSSLQHGAENQSHADLGSDCDVWVKPPEAPKDASEKSVSFDRVMVAAALSTVFATLWLLTGGHLALFGADPFLSGMPQ